MANNSFDSYDIKSSTATEEQTKEYYNSADGQTGAISNDDEKQFDIRVPAPQSLPSMYQNASRIDGIIQGIESVKNNVHQNLEMVIGRGEDLALLHKTSQQIGTQSSIFHQNSRQLRYGYCKDLYKQRCVIALVVIFVLYLVSAMVCGWSWSHCGR